MDKIHIRDLELFLNHGVYPEETALGQKFVFDVTCFWRQGKPERRMI